MTVRILMHAVWFVLVWGSLGAQQPTREFSLQADSPEFWKLVDKGARLETAGSGFGFT